MQCQPLPRSPIAFKTTVKSEKEIIHSGHFMVSHFEAEAQDDEYEVAVPVPESKEAGGDETPPNCDLQVFSGNKIYRVMPPGQLAIETSLNKLFQCMSLAYRQKLTSPKWNRFKGIRLRWKDKIRLNNVIWRCWHMQFIKRKNTLICQFASPLDEGIHNKPEAVVLEGKYWKRKLAAVTAEYKKWRLFYRNKIMGWAGKECYLQDTEIPDWPGKSTESLGLTSMMVDEDYMDLMSDTLFTTLSKEPFAFPDIREITRGASLADFIQPSLVQLQPNLDEYMDLEPLPEFFSSKLPPVPEDCAVADMTYRPIEMQVQSNRGHITSSTPSLPSTSTVQYQHYTEVAPMKPARYYQRTAGDAVMGGTTNKYNYTDTSAIKTARVYLSKGKDEYCKTGDKDGILMDGYCFESENVESGPTAGYALQAASTSQRMYQVDLATSVVAPVQQSYGYQFPKMPVHPPAPPPYGRTQQGYDLASCIPETSVIQKCAERSASLPSVDKEDVFIVPKHMSLKSRHRSRSGSSLLTSPKSRTHPPPLLSSSSDPNLNIQKSALLAQLLTTASPTVYNVTPTRTGNVPILPMPTNRMSNVPALPLNSAGTLLITPAPNPPQSYLTGPVHPTSPESSVSSPESIRVQSANSPGMCGPSTSTSPLLFAGPLSPKRGEGKASPQPHDHRRSCHINAEQKRRCNIRNGFEVLHSLIPHLQQSPNAKLSKAAMLQKGAEYIKQLQAERIHVKDDVESLKYQIDTLNASISNFQALLPATGAPVSRHRTTRMRETFDDWVRTRTNENWRFWVFSSLFESLFTSFNNSVSTASYEDLHRSSLMWVEHHCSLVELRPAVLNSLRNLSKTTDILADPQKLAEEARAAVNKKKKKGGSES